MAKIKSRKSAKKIAPTKAPNFVLIGIAILLFIVLILVWFNQKGIDKIPFKEAAKSSITPTVKVTPTPTPTPIPLHGGPADYQFSHGSNVKGPRISDVTIDPLDAKPTENQTITLKAAYTSNITGVNLTLNLDNSSRSYVLKQIDGTSTDGTWQIEIKQNDTHQSRYSLNFLLTSNVDNWKGAITIR